MKTIRFFYLFLLGTLAIPAESDAQIADNDASVLLAWRDDPAPPALDEPARALLKAFGDGYDAHIALEEGLVYPAAQATFDETGLARIGAEMQGRRRAPRPR